MKDFAQAHNLPIMLDSKTGIGYVSDSWLWCFRGWCVAVGERVQHERDVRHNGLSTGGNGHIWAHRWGWGSDGASVLWLLRNNETRKICSWICKYPEQLVRRSF